MATSNQSGNQEGRGGKDDGGSSERGFAAMDKDKQREIASEGGKASHERGTAHEFTSEEARRAGQKSHGGEGDDSGKEGSGESGGRSTRGGTPEQHAEAGRQSHKNDGK